MTWVATDALTVHPPSAAFWAAEVIQDFVLCPIVVGARPDSPSSLRATSRAS